MTDTLSQQNIRSDGGEFDTPRWTMWVEGETYARISIGTDGVAVGDGTGAPSLIADPTAAIAAAVAALVNSAPTTLDTLEEIADALGDDPNLATTLTTLIGTKVAKSLYDAHTILYATTDDTPAALTVGASTIVGRKATGNIVALTATELLAIIEAATALVHASTLDANTLLYAVTDDTPAALAVAASRIVGRKSSGNIGALTAAEIMVILAAGVRQITTNALGSVSTNQNIDFAAANVTTLSITAAVNLTPTNLPASGTFQQVKVYVTTDGTHVPTFVSVDWGAAGAPTFTASKTHEVFLSCVDGSTVHAAAALGFTS